MNGSLSLERLRDYADGVLPAPQARLLERALEQVAPASCEAATYLLVHRLSAPLLAPTPPSRLSFDDLRLADEPRGGPGGLAAGPRRWAVATAAAALLLALLGVWWCGRADPVPSGHVLPGKGRVRLAHVPWTREVPAPDARLVAGYRPTAKDQVAWLDDAQAAASLARASGRPVLRFVQHPECPMCRALEAGPLRDDEVLRALDAVVPVRIDVESLPKAEIQALMREGWPHLSVLGAQGEVLGNLSGMRPAHDLVARLTSALARAGSGAPPAWAALSAAAQTQARQRQAQRALQEAHDLATQDAGAARRRLEAERALLVASPEGDDLGRVLAAWAPEAPFPRIEEPPSKESTR